MLKERPVDRKPGGEPDEAERSYDEEGDSPAEERIEEAADEKRRDHGAHGGSSIEDGHSDGSLFLGKPFGDNFCCAWPVACFAKAQEEGAGSKAGEGGDGGVRHRSGAPDDDGDGEAQACAVTIIEPAGDALTHGIGEK